MKNPQLTIKMETGATIIIELFPEITVNSCRSIIALAKKGHYNGRRFYRVIKDFVLQTDCDQNEEFSTGCSYTIAGEYSESGFMTPQPSFDKYMVGLAGMGGTSNTSSGSSFYICMNKSDRLNGNYPIVGKVISGFEECERINAVAVDDTMVGKIAFFQPLSDEIMKEVTIECFGIDYPEPVTVPFTAEYLEEERKINQEIKNNRDKRA